MLSNISLLLVAIIWGSGFVASQMALDANLSSALLCSYVLRSRPSSLVWFLQGPESEHEKGTFKGRYRDRSVFVFGVLCSDRWTAIYDSVNNAFITASNVVMVPFLWWIISKKRPSLKIFISSFYVCLESEFYRLTFPPESRLNWEIC